MFSAIETIPSHIDSVPSLPLFLRLCNKTGVGAVSDVASTRPAHLTLDRQNER
jgi:hypothetical protein